MFAKHLNNSNIHKAIFKTNSGLHIKLLAALAIRKISSFDY